MVLLYLLSTYYSLCVDLKIYVLIQIAVLIIIESLTHSCVIMYMSIVLLILFRLSFEFCCSHSLGIEIHSRSLAVLRVLAIHGLLIILIRFVIIP